MPQVMDEADVGRAIKRIAHEMLERHRGADGLVLLGIHTRGVPLASALAAAVSELGEPVPVGEIDIGPYRDDLGRRPTTPGHPVPTPGRSTPPPGRQHP